MSSLTELINLIPETHIPPKDKKGLFTCPICNRKVEKYLEHLARNKKCLKIRINLKIPILADYRSHKCEKCDYCSMDIRGLINHRKKCKNLQVESQSLEHITDLERKEVPEDTSNSTAD